MEFVAIVRESLLFIQKVIQLILSFLICSYWVIMPWNSSLTLPGPPVFFERQSRLLCGQHVVNNLLQSAKFNEIDMAGFARSLYNNILAITGAIDASDLSSEHGNFDIEVVRYAFHHAGHGTRYFDRRNLMKLDNMLQYPNLLGLLCNSGHDHWVGMLNKDGTFYLMDSLQQEPMAYDNLDAVKEYLRQLTLSNGTIVQVFRDMTEETN